MMLIPVDIHILIRPPMTLLKKKKNERKPLPPSHFCLVPAHTRRPSQLASDNTIYSICALALKW